MTWSHHKDQEEIEEVRQLKRIADVLEKLYKLALNEEQEEKIPVKLSIEWKGATIMSTGSIALNLTPTAKAVGVVTELNADGTVFTFDPSKIAAAVKDPTIVSVTVDPTTGSPTVTPLAAGSTDVAIADTVTSVQVVYTFNVTKLATGSLSVSWTTTP